MRFCEHAKVQKLSIWLKGLGPPPSPSVQAKPSQILTKSTFFAHWLKGLGPHPPGPRVCERGPEPQGTPNHTFLSPNGSPWHHLGHGDRDPTQNSGADLARGVPPPQSQLFFDHFGAQKCPNVNFCELFEIQTAPSQRIWGPMGPLWGPCGPPWGPWGAQLPSPLPLKPAA